MLGLALSQSQGDGNFSAPQTDRDNAVQGTVKSSLTAVHPYVRYRPSAELEFWGVAGYGRGTMTLDVDDEDAANPDIPASISPSKARGKRSRTRHPITASASISTPPGKAW